MEDSQRPDSMAGNGGQQEYSPTSVGVTGMNEQSGIQMPQVSKKGKKPKKPIYKRVWFWIIVVIVLLIVMIANGNNSSNQNQGSNSGQSVQIDKSAKLKSISAVYTGSKSNGQQIDANNKSITVTAKYSNGQSKDVTGWTVANPAALDYNAAQTFTIQYKNMQTQLSIQADPPAEYQSALTKAKSYSDNMHMSKAGIYDQLTSEYGEQFSPEASQWAVDHLQADYNANALAKAKEYQSSMSMSPEAIRDQLTSDAGEKFTPDEANYAVQHLND